jgi:O-antigen ligase/Flp pilus assembly protein TadD
LVGAPAVFVPSMGDIFGLPKLGWVAVCVAVALVAFVVEGPGADDDDGRPMPRPAVLPFVVAFVAVVALATLTSIDRSTSLLGSYERYGGLLPLLLHLGLAALVLATWWRDPDDTRRLAAAIVGGGIVVASYVIVQVLGFDVIDWVEKSGAGVQYQAGTMGNGDFAAAYLGCALPLAWPLVQGAARRWQRVAIVAAAVELAVALVATKGRGGLLALAVGAVVAVGVVRPWQGSTTWRGRGMAVVCGGAAAVVALLAVVAVATSDVLRTESLDVRTREWAGGVAIFLDRPITGTGPDTYLLRYPAHRSVADGRALGLQIADKPHNLLVEYASSTGILGLAAFLALVGAIFWWGMRATLGRPTPDERLLPAAFLAVAAAYLAQSLFSFDVPALVGVWWVSLAVVVVHGDPVLVEARTSKPRKGARHAAAPRPSLPLTAGAGVVALLLVGVTLKAVVADVSAGRALATTGETALAHGEAALRMNPAQPAYALTVGAAGEQAGATTADDAARPDLFRRAIAGYRHGLADQPDNVVLRAGLARTLTLLGRAVDRGAFVEADREWRRAIVLDPNDWELHEAYGLMLNDWANASGSRELRSKAAGELQRALEIRPDRAATWTTLALVLESLGRNQEAAAAAARGLYLDPSNQQAKAIADRLARSG